MELTNLIETLGGSHFFVYLCTITVLFLALDALLPRYTKQHAQEESSRWLRNFAFYLVNSSVAYLLLVAFEFDVEYAATEHQIGLFHHIQVDSLLIQVIAYALLADFLTYWLHRLSHAWRPLWRLHLVHHSDVDLDFSVSFRFHPLERVLDIPIVMLTAVLLGIDLVTILLFNVAYSFFAFFPHSDIKVPPRLDKFLAWFICTPNVHRIHHSNQMEETNSNYGDIFTFWDRLFGTYREASAERHEHITIGLEYFRQPKDQTLLASMLQPFAYRGEMSAMHHPASSGDTIEATKEPDLANAK